MVEITDTKMEVLADSVMVNAPVKEESQFISKTMDGSSSTALIREPAAVQYTRLKSSVLLRG